MALPGCWAFPWPSGLYPKGSSGRESARRSFWGFRTQVGSTADVRGEFTPHPACSGLEFHSSSAPGRAVPPGGTQSGAGVAEGSCLGWACTPAFSKGVEENKSALQLVGAVPVPVPCPAPRGTHPTTLLPTPALTPGAHRANSVL